jgi:hypothetical protein
MFIKFILGRYQFTELNFTLHKNIKIETKTTFGNVLIGNPMHIP